MSAAIYFEGDAYSIAGPKLMGRNAAGESFLRGYLAHVEADHLWVEASSAQAAKPFLEAARAAGRSEPISIVTPEGMAALATPGTLYFPASDIGFKARHRSLFGAANWSICGITHTTASARAADGIAELLTGAVEPWDALICTSKAVRDNVETVLAAELEHLQRRLGITRVIRPEMPIIPLGIHVADFASDAPTRAAARAAVGADDDTIVVLYAGRLSFHAKAHPAAMYLALEEAARRQRGSRVILIECGWFANASLQAAFDEACAALCPSVQVVRLDGRDASARRTAWACADVFCSLADNIQETFGLTPIEAMAAGLPVVVSDWDGYRDTVRDKVDGFRIPTLMPPAGSGGDLSARHALNIDTYDRYCGYTAAFISVDVAAAADAFAALFASPDLRRNMGMAGQARARADYDWRSIIPQYQQLWSLLGDIRAKAAPVQQPRHPWPGRLDPFASFASYPTARLSPAAQVVLIDSTVDAAKARFHRMRALGMINYTQAVVVTAAEAEAMIDSCAAGARSAAEVSMPFPPERRAQIFRALAWLAKLGVVRITD